MLLTIALFTFWAVVGCAALAPRRRFLLRDLLLAPVTGMAITVLPVFLLSRAGVPVRSLGWPVTLSLALISAAVLAWFRPVVGLRRYVPFAAVLLGALIMTGRPMLEFGFHWVSYCNDDMANYCLSAHRFLDHGFNDPPAAVDLLHGRDFSQFYWFMYVPGGSRPGVDLLLAWVVSLTRLTAHQAFMPLILAFHLVLISAGGALMCRPEGAQESAWPAWWTCALLAASALMTLGAVYQLLGQVAGLALLTGCVALLLRPVQDFTRQERTHEGILIGLLMSSLLIAYPEVFPFLGLSVLLYLVLNWKEWRGLARPLGTLGVGGAVILLLLNGYLGTVLRYLSRQATARPQGGPGTEVFPFYLVPTGLANLWGWLPLNGPWPDEPWLSVLIVLGAILLAGVGVGVCGMARRAHPAAVVSVVMLCLAGWLFHEHFGFGLFKLAMYIQPFLLGTIVAMCFRIIPRPWPRAVGLVLLMAAGLRGQLHYVQASRGTSALYVEIPNPSQANLLAQLEQVAATVRNKRVLADTYNVVLGKFLALYLRGTDCAMPATGNFSGIVNFNQNCSSEFAGVAESLREQLSDVYLDYRFDLRDLDTPGAANSFRFVGIGVPSEGEKGFDFLLSSTERSSVLNRWHARAGEAGTVRVEAWDQVQNHLVFQSSELGRRYCDVDKGNRRTSLHALELDPLCPGGTMAGCGRYLLFYALKPTPGARFRLDFTTYFQGDGENNLPPAVAIGADRYAFPLVGRGSARVFSPALTPQIIAGHPFFGIGMGKEGKVFPEHRTGAMALYGKNTPRDRRRLIGFLRDISLVSEEDYAGLRPPQQLKHFPEDLRQRDLEYSGIFEDGWVSEDSYCCLGRSHHPAALTVCGEVPVVSDPSFTTELRLLLDGQELARRMLAPGQFEIVVPTPAGAGRSRIDLHFSAVQRLPNGDGRPVAAHVFSIGFTDLETHQEQGKPLILSGAPTSETLPQPFEAERRPWTGEK